MNPANATRLAQTGTSSMPIDSSTVSPSTSVAFPVIHSSNWLSGVAHLVNRDKIETVCIINYMDRIFSTVEDRFNCRRQIPLYNTLTI